MTQPVLPPNKVAIIIDGEVVELLHTNSRLAAALLSEPTIVDVTDLLAEDPHAVRHTTKYDPATGTFTNKPIEA